MADEIEGKRSIGTVRWFSARRGFGFISPDEGGDDLFVHQMEIRSDGFRTLSEGQPVEFSVDLAGDGRSKAVRINVLRRRGRGGRRGSRGRGGEREGGECYNCGRTGHFERDCYRGRGGGGRRYRGGRGGSRGGGCFCCGEEGHFARDCPQG